MGQFSGLLNSTEIGMKDGRTVHRLNGCLVWAHGEKRVEIPEGFETDLASVPRLPFIYWIWGDRAHREAVLHDYLYRIDAVLWIGTSICKDVEKKEADWLFREAMKGQGRSWGIYQPMYIAVRAAGGSSFHRMKIMDHFELDEVA